MPDNNPLQDILHTVNYINNEFIKGVGILSERLDKAEQNNQFYTIGINDRLKAIDEVIAKCAHMEQREAHFVRALDQALSREIVESSNVKYTVELLCKRFHEIEKTTNAIDAIMQALQKAVADDHIRLAEAGSVLLESSTHIEGHADHITKLHDHCHDIDERIANNINKRIAELEKQVAHLRGDFDSHGRKPVDQAPGYTIEPYTTNGIGMHMVTIGKNLKSAIFFRECDAIEWAKLHS